MANPCAVTPQVCVRANTTLAWQAYSRAVWTWKIQQNKPPWISGWLQKSSRRTRLSATPYTSAETQGPLDAQCPLLLPGDPTIGDSQTAGRSRSSSQKGSRALAITSSHQAACRGTLVAYRLPGRALISQAQGKKTISTLFTHIDSFQPTNN